MKIISYWTRSLVFNGDTPISTHFHSDFLSFIWSCTDGAAHKLKLRSFHKSAHLQVHPADFHPGVNHAWQSGGLYLFSVSFFFFIFLFLEPRVRVRVMRSHCCTTGHIRWQGHKSHDAWKEVEGFVRMISYNMCNTWLFRVG